MRKDPQLNIYLIGRVKKGDGELVNSTIKTENEWMGQAIQR